MKTCLCFIVGLFVTFIHGFTVPAGCGCSRRGGNWMLLPTTTTKHHHKVETNLFSKKKKKGAASPDKGSAAAAAAVRVPQGPTAAAAAQKAEATARGLLAARLEMEAKQQQRARAATNHHAASSSSPTAAAAQEMTGDPKKSEATARALLAARFEMEAKQRAENQAAAVTEIALEQEEAEKAQAAIEAVLEMERKAAIRDALLETAKASARKAEATARALLATRLDRETRMRAAAAMPETVVEAGVQGETEPVVARVAEPEPGPDVEETEAMASVAEPKPESEPEVVQAEVSSLETVAEPEPVQTQPESKETVVEPRAGALVAINQETIEFTSGLIGGAIGFSFGGPVLAAIVASVANYFSRKQDESYANVIQSISKTTIEAFNAVSRTEAQLQILKKSKKALEGTLESLKKSDGVDPEAIQQVEDTLVKVTGKLAELNEELDPVGAALVALKAIGDLIEKIFDAAGEVNREYELTERATSSIKEAVEKTKSGLNY